MHPYFNSLQEFLTMGKHGSYVWSSWGITLIVVLAFILYSLNQRHRLIKELKIQQARQQQRKPSHPASRPR